MYAPMDLLKMKMEPRVLTLMSVSIHSSMAPARKTLIALTAREALNVDVVRDTFRAEMLVSKLMNVKESLLKRLQVAWRSAKPVSVPPRKLVFSVTIPEIQSVTPTLPWFVPVITATASK